MDADPSLVTETLEILFDRDERGVDVTREELRAVLRASSADVDAAIDHLVAGADLVDTAGGVRLTSSGRELAAVAVRRHRLTERLLLDVIGLDWWKVHHEAERWEGVISEEIEQRLVELLGDPGTCPHGNPIPGSANRPDQRAAIRLDQAPAGPLRVVRITEELEADDQALRLLEQCGFVPGRNAELKAVGSDGVEVAGTVADAHLPPHVAAQTYVTPQ